MDLNKSLLRHGLSEPEFYVDLVYKLKKIVDLNKSLLRHGLSEPEFYVDLVYKLKKIVDSNYFSAQFI